MGLDTQDDRTRKRLPRPDQSKVIRDERGLNFARIRGISDAEKTQTREPVSQTGVFRRSRFIASGLRVALGFLAVSLLVNGMGAVRAADIVAPEHEVKAVYVFNFGIYATWPKNTFSNPSVPFVIGIIGNELVASALERIAKEQTVHGRRIEVRRSRAADDFTGFQIVFIGKGQDAKAILRRIGPASVLTVGEESSFTENGGMFGFVLINENVKFDANPPAISSANLEVTSRVLRLARRIIKQPPNRNGGKP